MTAPHDASTTQAARRRLLSLLHDDDLDGALQAGLMEYAVLAGDAEDAPIHEAQARLRTAWAARERFRARESRLARRAAERAARRAATLPVPSATGDATATVVAAARPALPAAAAAALARARERAAGKKVE